MRILVLSLLFVWQAAPLIGQEANQAALELTLPAEFYAVPSVEMNLYFDNVVLTKTPEDYRFNVTCDIGKIEKRRWTLTPKAGDVGTHKFSIEVRNKAGQKVAAASTRLRVVAANAGAGREIRLLIVGDSLTNASLYPNELARLLSQPGNPRWRMLGTHQPALAAKGVFHEGYSGWTWQRFVAKYEPNPDGTHRKRSSPFVYLADNGRPKLDVARYFQKECDGQKPDYVIIMLGINDCFHAPPSDLAGIDQRIDGMFGQADILIKAFRQAAPQAEIGICLTTPPNSREAAFQANYQDRYSRWGWKRIQHRLVQRQLKKFAGQARNSIYLIPTQLNLDPIEGYPAKNGVHPNAVGYKQIGASLFAWLKWRLASASP